MRLVNYIICYSPFPLKRGEIGSTPLKHIIRKIRVTDSLDADEMYEICRQHLSRICKGRSSLIAAFCSGEYVDFCFLESNSFHSNNCLACTCTFKKHFKEILKKSVETPEQEKSEYVHYTYRGTFMKDGVSEKRCMDLRFTQQKPLVLNKFLCDKFKEEFEKKIKEHGWEMVGLSLVREEPTGCYSDPSVFHPDEHYEVVWVRVQDLSQSKGESYIPGYKQNGKIWSVLGELVNPDNEDDMLPFTQCPIEGYIVVKKPI